MSPHVESRRFERPDTKLDFHEHGQIDIVRLSDGTAGLHVLLEPGWTWSIDEKPLLGNPDTCPMAHTGYCIRGEVVIQMVETNEETRIRAGDFFEIPRGHDAYVPGTEACELILIEPPGASGIPG
jgi:hypothetical protein